MGQKDLTAKDFIGCPEVFADIGNVLLYEGVESLQSENLRPAPTETIYEGEKGELHDQMQDISMYEEQLGRIRMQYIYENQTKQERRMVFRKAGYCGGVYRGQLKTLKRFPEEFSEGTGQKYAQEPLREFPCVCIVLYWGKGRWKQPRSMEELFRDDILYERDREYIDNIRLHVFEMRNLSREVRGRFKSDMRFVADYLAEDEEHIPKHQKVLHVEEMLRMLKAITGDARYTEIIESLRERQKEKGEVEMCEILDTYINRGIEQGITQGIEQGIEQGIAQGEDLLAKLITCLLRDERNGDIAVAATDEKRRQTLYREYGLVTGGSYAQNGI